MERSVRMSPVTCSVIRIVVKRPHIHHWLIWLVWWASNPIVSSTWCAECRCIAPVTLIIADKANGFLDLSPLSHQDQPHCNFLTKQLLIKPPCAMSLIWQDPRIWDCLSSPTSLWNWPTGALPKVTLITHQLLHSHFSFTSHTDLTARRWTSF